MPRKERSVQYGKTEIAVIKPLNGPKVMPIREIFDMKPAPSVIWLGAAVIGAVAAFFIVFW